MLNNAKTEYEQSRRHRIQSRDALAVVLVPGSSSLRTCVRAGP